MNTAGRNDAELITCQKIHSDYLFINGIIVRNYAVCIKDKDSSVYTYGIKSIIISNTDNVGTDI